jgi:1,4-dihydroxy-2-naphthoate polyprenyltransferase
MTHEKLKAWIQASRPPFFVATVVPIVIGWTMARGSRPLLFFLILLGAFLVHFATNIVNDYFDCLEGADSGTSIGGSRVIQEGKISPRQIFWAIILFYTLAFLIALGVMAKLHLFSLLPLVLFAWFSSFFYVAPPVRYGYYGFGEPFVAANMGPVMVVGTFWVIKGYPAWAPFYISIPVGLMVASILYYQSLPDMKTDAAVGKRTIAVRLGRRRAYIALVAFWVTIYLSIMLLSALGLLSWLSLLSLLTLPIFARMIGLVKRTADWQELHGQGQYARVLYLFCGAAIIVGLF